MLDIDYKGLMSQVRRGAFLTVEHDGELNTMTIGWLQLGFFWTREVLTVGVRPTRFTHHIIEEAAYYAVSIPHAHQFKSELSLCGTQSGRDIDKFDMCNLPLQYYGEENIPYVAIPGEHLFGKIIYKTTIQEHEIHEDLDRFYPERDYHTLYIAKLIDRVTIA